MSKCKFCGEQIPNHIDICPYCCESQSKDTRVCPYCEEIIDSKATRCPVCGETLSCPDEPLSCVGNKDSSQKNIETDTNFDDEEEQTESSNNKRALVIATISLAVVVICIGGFFGQRFLNKNCDLGNATFVDSSHIDGVIDAVILPPNGNDLPLVEEQESNDYQDQPYEYDTVEVVEDYLKEDISEEDAYNERDW